MLYIVQINLIWLMPDLKQFYSHLQRKLYLCSSYFILIYYIKQITILPGREQYAQYIQAQLKSHTLDWIFPVQERNILHYKTRSAFPRTGEMHPATRGLAFLLFISDYSIETNEASEIGRTSYSRCENICSAVPGNKQWERHNNRQGLMLPWQPCSDVVRGQ